MNAPVSIVECCDNIKFLKDFPDKYFDIIIDDPPYGINAPIMQMGSNPNRKGKNEYPSISTAVKLKGRLNQGSGKLKNRVLNKSTIGWDNSTPSPEYFKEAIRISKNQVFFGGNYFNLGPTRCIICWDKLQPWENFSQWEMAWTSFDKPAIMIKISNTGGANSETKIHPTQKPIPLYTEILRRLAKPGDKILDAHMGSQSSRIAAYKLGFDFWGCEIDEDYFREGCERFDRECHEIIKENNGVTNQQQKLLFT